MKYLLIFALFALCSAFDFVKPISVSLGNQAPQPDLVISAIDAGVFHAEHKYVPIRYTITNRGNAKAELKDVRIQAYWTNNGSDEKRALAYFNQLVLKNFEKDNVTLAAGASFETSFDADVPEKGVAIPGIPIRPNFNPQGMMGLTVILDIFDTVKESKEYNNTAKTTVNFNIRDHRN